MALQTAAATRLMKQLPCMGRKAWEESGWEWLAGALNSSRGRFVRSHNGQAGRDTKQSKVD